MFSHCYSGKSSRPRTCRAAHLVAATSAIATWLMYAKALLLHSLLQHWRRMQGCVSASLSLFFSYSQIFMPKWVSSNQETKSTFPVLKAAVQHSKATHMEHVLKCFPCVVWVQCPPNLHSKLTLPKSTLPKVLCPLPNFRVKFKFYWLHFARQFLIRKMHARHLFPFTSWYSYWLMWFLIIHHVVCFCFLNIINN